MLRQINKNYKNEENQQKGVKKRQHKKSPNVRNYLGKKKFLANNLTESLLGARKSQEDSEVNDQQDFEQGEASQKFQKVETLSQKEEIVNDCQDEQKAQNNAEEP